MKTRLWARVRLAILARASYRCGLCGSYANQVDHKVPLAKGGSPYASQNLQAMCQKCHRIKTSTENRGRELSQAEVAWADLVNHT